MRGEKEVAAHWIELAATAVPLLEGDWRACRKALVKIQKKRAPDATSRYILAVVAPLVEHKPAVGKSGLVETDA